MQMDLEQDIFPVSVLHMCLACCQTNKGAMQPEVKQHTFPYRNHMAICQSLCTPQHRFLLATHLCHKSHIHRNTNLIIVRTLSYFNQKTQLSSECLHTSVLCYFTVMAEKFSRALIISHSFFFLVQCHIHHYLSGNELWFTSHFPNLLCLALRYK